MTEEKEVFLRNNRKDIQNSAYDQGCNWPPAYTYTVGELPSGLYLMQASVPTSSSTEETNGIFIPFVVKRKIKENAPGVAPILVIFPTSRVLAYNEWPNSDGINNGGRSLYTPIPDEKSPLWHCVHIERPEQFGKTPKMGGKYFAHEYDSLLSFLGQNELAADFGVSYDLHADPDYLDAHTLYISMWHDEYWSREMRDNVEAFIANGGNAAFLSGNNVWWAVRFYENVSDAEGVFKMSPIQNGSGRLMVCYKDQADPIEKVGPSQQPADLTRATHNWHDPLPSCAENKLGPDRPGSNLVGLSSRRGATCNKRPLPEVYFKGNWLAHWIYQGVDQGSNMEIGRPPSNPCKGSAQDVGLVQVVGYETDAIDEDSPPSLVNFAGTPDLLGLPPHPKGGGEKFQRLGKEDQAAAFGNVVMFRRNGTVFSAGTTGWIEGLNPVNSLCRVQESNNPGSPTVTAITRNVLKRLSARNPAGIAVANSGFERWQSDDTPSGWSVGSEGGTVRRKPKLENARRNASFSAELDGSKGTARLVSCSCPVQQGRWYRITAWIKTSASSDQLGLELVGDEGELPTTPFVKANAHSGSGKWELLSAVGSIPEGIKQAKIHIWCAAGEKIEVDDVLLEDLDRLNDVDVKNGNERMNGQYARGVPIKNANFEGGWEESGAPVGWNSPSGWSDSDGAKGKGWRGDWSVSLGGDKGPASVTQRLAPIEWRSYYRIGMWAFSEQEGGAVARLWRLESKDGPRAELIAEAKNQRANTWDYAWDIGAVDQGAPQVFWAELELTTADGSRASIDNVAIDVVGAFDEHGQLT